MPAQPGCQRLGCSTVQHIEAHVHLWKEPALRGALQGWTGGSQVAPAQGTVLFLHRAPPQQRDNTCTLDAYQCTSPAAGARPRTCRPAAATWQSDPAHRLTPAGWRRQQEGVAFMLGVAAAGAAGVPERAQDVQAELGLDGRCSARAGGRRRRRQLAVAAGMPPLAKPALQRNLGGSFGPARAPSQLSPACRGRAGLAGLPSSTSCAALLVHTHVCARLQP